MREFAIVGLGMIGGSIAKDIREVVPEANIGAMDPDASQVEKAIETGVVDYEASYEEIARRACFVVIASPIDTVIPVAQKIVEATDKVKPEGKLYVLDAASVKAKITPALAALTTDQVEFISTHPMAGTEYSGFPHSRKHLFNAKPWMVCPHDSNTDEGIETAERFIAGLGGLTREIDATEHDRHVARVSHAIIMLSNYAFDFIASTHPDSLEYAGDGFTSTTRLASGNPRLHADILGSNEQLTKEALQEFLAYLQERLASDQPESQDFFAQNMARRNDWIHKKR
jgi:prephenate dehydrogenase